jgi:hypothetical protein
MVILWGKTGRERGHGTSDDDFVGEDWARAVTDYLIFTTPFRTSQMIFGPVIHFQKEKQMVF